MKMKNSKFDTLEDRKSIFFLLVIVVFLVLSSKGFVLEFLNADMN